MQQQNTILFLGALLFAVTGTSIGGQEKVDVCHITGTFDFGNGEVPIGHEINIADPAYQSHIDHGDPEVWAVIEMADGTELCTASVGDMLTCPCWNTFTQSQLAQILSDDAENVSGDIQIFCYDERPGSAQATIHHNATGLQAPIIKAGVAQDPFSGEDLSWCSFRLTTNLDLPHRIPQSEATTCMDEIVALQPLISWCP